MSKLTVLSGDAQFDEKRNTSRVFQPEHGAVAEALNALRRARSKGWYRWVVARQNGEHLHGEQREDGTPAACPVQGCREGAL